MATQIQPDISDLATQTDLPSLLLQMPSPRSHSQAGEVQSRYQSHSQSTAGSCSECASPLPSAGMQTAPGASVGFPQTSSVGSGPTSSLPPVGASVSAGLNLVSQAAQTHAQSLALACGARSELVVSQAVQTHHRPWPPPSCCELSTQTPTPDHASTPAPDHAHATDYDLMLQSLVDFGTQTAGSALADDYDDMLQSFADSSTQTTRAARGADYTSLLQSSVDFGTQTADSAWPLSLLDDDDDDASHPLSPNLLPPLECMDFGTQTLESSSLLSLDFGVQFPTLDDHDTRDQGCQTTNTHESVHPT